MCEKLNITKTKSTFPISIRSFILLYPFYKEGWTPIWEKDATFFLSQKLVYFLVQWIQSDLLFFSYFYGKKISPHAVKTSSHLISLNPSPKIFPFYDYLFLTSKETDAN